jgi:glucokinase
MVILENGPECSCGRWGCFETLTSTRALFRRAGARRPDFVPSLSVHDIYQAAEAQESWACEAIQETLHYVKRGVVNSANMLDVDAIFLGGPLSQLNEYLLDAVKDALDAELLVRDYRHPVVRLATFKEEAGAVGAAALVLRDALRRPRPGMAAAASSLSSVASRTAIRESAAHLDALDRSGNL